MIARIALLVLMALQPQAVNLAPALYTDPVTHDADDPAIWINRKNARESRIVGTDKDQEGALYVFDIKGKVRQIVKGLNRPNNVDVEQNSIIGGLTRDIAVATERGAQRLRIFAIDAEGQLTDVSGQTKLFDGEAGDRAAAMGVALYKRPKDGAVFAIVSRKSGPADGYLYQYRLTPEPNNKIGLVKARAFGKFIGGNEIEAIAVDDAQGIVYYSDEGYGVHRYRADPDAPNASQPLGVFAATGFEGDHEGIGIYATGPRTGYIVVSDQRKGESWYWVWRRDGDFTTPHKVVKGADDTDGLDCASASLGTAFPRGLVVAMNSKGKNFAVYDAARFFSLK